MMKKFVGIIICLLMVIPVGTTVTITGHEQKLDIKLNNGLDVTALSQNSGDVSGAPFYDFMNGQEKGRDDITPPSINFVPPTPENGTIIPDRFIPVNLSANDEHNFYTFVDFNHDLRLWMRMDDASSPGEGATVYDLSSYQNNGTAYGNAQQTTTGYFGKGFSFDGSGDYISISDSSSLDISQAITISACFKTSTTSTRQVIAAKTASGDNTWLMEIHFNGRINFYLNAGDTASNLYSSTAINANTWYHVVGVYNGTKRMIYINGVLDASVNDSGNINLNNREVTIGDWSSNDRPLNGIIDEVLIFNRALTPDEIKTLYNGQTNHYFHTFTGLSNGSYQFTGYAVDQLGYKSQTKTRHVTVSIMDNQPPFPPANPYPSDGATYYVPPLVCLSWTGGDPDGDLCTYDIYFGTVNRPPKVMGNQTLTSYDPGLFAENTVYYWQIVSWDSFGMSTSGPIWQFITRNISIDFAGQWGGENYGVAVEGNLAYVGIGPRVIILDVTDSSTPIYLGKSAVLPHTVSRIVVRGNYAYIADFYGGFQIIDVTDPTAPEWIGGYHPEQQANFEDIAVEGNYVYIADYYYGLHIIDVSDPYKPERVGGFDTPSYTSDIEVIQNKAYLADCLYGIYIIDVSDPAAPQLLGVYSETAHGLHVNFVDGYAYMTGNRPGTHIIDVRTPENASRSAIYQSDDFILGHLVTSGSYAYVPCGSSGLKIFDVTNPVSPVQIRLYDTKGYARDVVIANNLAYVADGTGGIVIINVSDPTNPFFVAVCSTGYARYVAYESSHIYVSDNSTTSLKVINVSNPQSPFIEGSCPTTSLPETVAVSNGYAYVGTFYAGLDIIDVSDPAHPILVNNIKPFPDDMYSFTPVVSLAGNFAFLVCKPKAVSMIDISHPTAPVVVTNYMMPYPEDLTLMGNYLYIADEAGGLVVLSVRIPGDMNADGRVDFGDINPFVLALCSGYDAYHEQFPYGNWYNADINNDGQVDFGDINPFVAILSGRS